MEFCELVAIFVCIELSRFLHNGLVDHSQMTAKNKKLTKSMLNSHGLIVMGVTTALFVHTGEARLGQLAFIFFFAAARGFISVREIRQALN